MWSVRLYQSRDQRTVPLPIFQFAYLNQIRTNGHFVTLKTNQIFPSNRWEMFPYDDHKAYHPPLLNVYALWHTLKMEFWLLLIGVNSWNNKCVYAATSSFTSRYIPNFCIFYLFVWSFSSHSRIFFTLLNMSSLPVKGYKFLPILGTYGH